MIPLIPLTEPSGQFIGIDFGTTHSLVAGMRNGRIKAFPILPKKTTLLPSVAAKGPNGLLIGEDAVHAGSAALRSFKRFLTTVPEEVTFGDASLLAVHPLSNLMAALFSSLRQTAEQYVGQPIAGAVITVPASFDAIQRQAVCYAAEQAGLNILRTLNEPTAAALTIENYSPCEGDYLGIYDLGGGTFDFSLLRSHAKGWHVLASAGDAQLGGDDVDEAIARYMAAKHSAHSAAHLHWKEWINEAKYAKEQLSLDPSTCIELNAGCCPTCWQSFNSETLEALTTPFILKTIAVVESVLKAGKIEKTLLKQVVMVGGSTRLAPIKRLLTDYLGQTPYQLEAPEETVAIGAAMLAQQLGGTLGTERKTLVDVTPLNLGIENLYGQVDVLIPKNTPLPVKRTEVFTNAVTGQKGLLLKIVQGNAPMALDCRVLGEYQLLDLPTCPANSLQIEVSFELDVNGALRVHAQERTAQKQLEIQIKQEALYPVTAPVSGSRSHIDGYKDDIERLDEANKTLAWLEDFKVNELSLHRLLIELKKQLKLAVETSSLKQASYLIDRISQLVAPILWMDIRS